MLRMVKFGLGEATLLSSILGKAKLVVVGLNNSRLDLLGLKVSLQRIRMK